MRPLNKLIVALLLAVASAGQSDSPTVRPSGRNFFFGILEGAHGASSAPLHWSARQWGLAAAAGAGLAAMVNNDPALYHPLRGRRDWLDKAAPVFREMGEGPGIAGAAVLWGLGAAFKRGELAASSRTALQAVAVAGAFSGALKPAFAANRPGTDEQHHALFEYSGARFNPFNGSFPSGHTMVAFSLAEVYGASYGRWWTYPLAACTGYARIYEGAHWPSDVLLGALLGAGIGQVAVRLRRYEGPPFQIWAGAEGLRLGWSGRF